MKIICQQCTKGKSSKVATGSYREKKYTENGPLWMQLVCDKCSYVTSEHEVWERNDDLMVGDVT